MSGSSLGGTVAGAAATIDRAATARAVIALAVIALLVSSCRTASNADPFAFDSAPLFGMIYDLDNRPCAGIELVVDGKDKATSDIDGRFVLLSLKRGPHGLSARGDGYETVGLGFDFANRTQVLYLKMVSFDQLLAQAQDALDRRKWGDADALLTRAAAIRESDTVLVYLRAILDFQRGSAGQAAARLESLVESGTRIPYVFLFLADLYEHSLGDPGAARKALAGYLKQIDDPDVRKRLQALADTPE